MITDLNKIPAGWTGTSSGLPATFPSEGKAGEKARTPELIGAEIRMYAEAGRRITLLCGIEIGRRLVEAKELLEHGEWLPWLERETDFSTSSAQRYMQVFREYGAAQQSLFGPVANCPTLGNLSITNALRLLAVPEEERESFAKAHDVEHLSAREVEALVKERTAALEAEKQKLSDAVDVLTRGQDNLKKDCYRFEEKLQISEQERAKAEEHLLRIQQEIREIESRPQPVAVERDEQAIQEAVQAEREKARAQLEKDVEAARKEAEKAAKEKISDLNKEIKAFKEQQAEAAKQLEEVRAKAEAAEKAGAESKQLRAQIKDLEGKLTLASPEVAAFKAAFDRAQAELVTMLKALRQVQDDALKAKLTGAVRTMLSNFGGQVGG